MCAVAAAAGAAGVESGRLCHSDGGCEGGDRPPEAVEVGYPRARRELVALSRLGQLRRVGGGRSTRYVLP